MNYKVEDSRCPYCGGTEFVTGEQSYYGAVNGVNNIWGCGQPLRHVICRNCGSVVRSYVSNPEKLLKRRDRRIDD